MGINWLSHCRFGYDVNRYGTVGSQFSSFASHTGQFSDFATITTVGFAFQRLSAHRRGTSNATVRHTFDCECRLEKLGTNSFTRSTTRFGLSLSFDRQRNSNARGGKAQLELAKIQALSNSRNSGGSHPATLHDPTKSLGDHAAHALSTTVAAHSCTR